MRNEQYTILLVDDEPDILEFLGYNLRKEGYKVFTAKDGKSALKILKELRPHLIILDIMMPEMTGIETCNRIRGVPELKDSLIAFLTARGEDYSQIAGFEAGADDYITKPIKPKVFLVRVKALLKRYNKFGNNKIDSEGVLKIGKLIIDREKYKITYDEINIKLPKKEFSLLELLVSMPDKVFTRDEIYTNVWGNNVVVGDRTIDVHIRKIRKKLPEIKIETIKGVGYKFVE